MTDAGQKTLETEPPTLKLYACDEPEGFELIRHMGAITTLEPDEEQDVPRRVWPFGFRAPAAPKAPPSACGWKRRREELS